jgi:hypothetical protein
MKKTVENPMHRSRKALAKPAHGPGTLSAAEVRKLVLQAKDAYAHQRAQGRVEPGQPFDDWRRDQVADVAGVPGISKLSRSQFRTVLAHFLTLSGKDEDAFQLLTRTGTKRDRGPAGETYESAEAVVFRIREALAAHAEFPQDQLRGSRITEAWLLAAAQQRTAKPSLSLDDLAGRLDNRTLIGLLAHLRNWISLREGRSDSSRRSSRHYPQPPDPGDFQPDL